MSEKKNDQEQPVTHEPAGLGVRSHGLAAEYAHEQGWGSDEEQRTKTPEPAAAGGTDYDYGPEHFGDTPVDEKGVEPSSETVEFLTGKKKDQR